MACLSAVKRDEALIDSGAPHHFIKVPLIYELTLKTVAAAVGEFKTVWRESQATD